MFFLNKIVKIRSFTVKASKNNFFFSNLNFIINYFDTIIVNIKNKKDKNQFFKNFKFAMEFMFYKYYKTISKTIFITAFEKKKKKGLLKGA